MFEGDRIPSRPYLTLAWGGSLRFGDLLMRGDSIEPYYLGRFVGSYLRSWSSAGDLRFKDSVPDQLSHTLGATYSLGLGNTRLFGTLEVQNLTDQALFDSFGMQRPGRAYYFKLGGDI